MSCMYCGKPTSRVIEGADCSVCEKCWKLLQNPVTALPLIRGHLTLTLRGTIPEDKLKLQIDKFMEQIATWKRPA